MDEKFVLGLGIGMLGGAIVVANSTKAKKLVVEGQTAVKSKVKEIAKKDKNNSK